MARQTATNAGRRDAEIWMQETPESEWADAIKPGVLGADEALINGLGYAEAAKRLGISNPYRSGKPTDAASTAFEEYSRAWANRVRAALDAEKASGRHATKKSPAQLQREIDEVLSGWGVGSVASLTGYRVEKLTDDHINEIYRDAQARGDTKTAKLAAKAAYAYDKPGEKVAALAAHLAGKKRLGRPSRSHSTKKPHITSPEGRLADLQRQGFMKRGPMRKWMVVVEAPSGDPTEATYLEVQGKTEAAALRAARERKPTVPASRFSIRYAF